MPHLFQNVTISVSRDGHLPFLQALAKKDPGGMSRYIRGLIDADPMYMDWLQSHQIP